MENHSFPVELEEERLFYHLEKDCFYEIFYSNLAANCTKKIQLNRGRVDQL